MSLLEGRFCLRMTFPSVEEEPLNPVQRQRGWNRHLLCTQLQAGLAAPTWCSHSLKNLCLVGSFIVHFPQEVAEAPQGWLGPRSLDSWSGLCPPHWSAFRVHHSTSSFPAFPQPHRAQALPSGGTQLPEASFLALWPLCRETVRQSVTCGILAS